MNKKVFMRVLLSVVPVTVYFSFAVQNTRLNFKEWLPTVARLVFYFLTIKAANTIFDISYKILYQKETFNFKKCFIENHKSLIMFGISVTTIMIYGKRQFFDEHFAFVCLAYIMSEFSKVDETPQINYGVGMACSFYEGYLALTIPSDGSPSHVGIEDKIKTFEDEAGVLFPVRKLLIVITKSLYCPPDMKEFNKNHRTDLAYVEAVLPLGDLVKDVAGVKNRTYRNSVYKICRPDNLPVYICAEFATPLLTLKKVLDKRVIYDKLCDVDKDEIREDFCRQLKTILTRSPECGGKCELVYYDDTDPSQNIADVLLDAIEKIEPDFDDLIQRHRQQNPVVADIKN